MPIDPQIVAMFANAPEWPPVRSMPLAELRNAVRQASIAIPAPQAQFANIENRTIAGPGGSLSLRIYTPAGNAPFSVIVYFHGGGWVVGDLDTQDMIARTLAAEAGSVVVSVDYRLAPEHPFPAAVEDAWAATLWAAAHATEIGGTPGHLAVAGDSAGGVLACVVALMARDAGAPRLSAQVNFYGSCNFPSTETPSAREFSDGPVLRRDDVDYFWSLYLSHEADRDDFRASPFRAPSHAGVAPAFIGTAECDPSRDDAEAYAEKLRSAGVHVEAPSLCRHGAWFRILGWIPACCTGSCCTGVRFSETAVCCRSQLTRGALHRFEEFMTDDEKKLSGGVAVITGAGAGIGSGLARRAGAIGMTVVVTDIAPQRAEAVAAEIRAAGGHAEAITVDVSKPAELDRLAEAVFEKYGSVRLLVNNAGIETIGYSWEIPAERWEATLNINLHGVIHGVRAFVPRMLAKGDEAWIANLSSIGAFGIMPTQAAYILTKHAVQSFSECLFLELKLTGAPIHVASVIPGMLKTGIFDAAAGAGEPAGAARHRKTMHDLMAAYGMDLAEGCQRILEQVAANKFWVSTQPEMTTQSVQSRIDFFRAQSEPELGEQVRQLLGTP